VLDLCGLDSIHVSLQLLFSVLIGGLLAICEIIAPRQTHTFLATDASDVGKNMQTTRLLYAQNYITDISIRIAGAGCMECIISFVPKKL